MLFPSWGVFSDPCGSSAGALPGLEDTIIQNQGYPHKELLGSLDK